MNSTPARRRRRHLPQASGNRASQEAASAPHRTAQEPEQTLSSRFQARRRVTPVSGDPIPIPGRVDEPTDPNQRDADLP